MMGTKAFALSAIVAVSLAVTGSYPANAQPYPERLIKIVVPFPAGGPSDVAARLVTQPLSSKLGQSVIIENLPGAGGRTGAKAVAQASPDGYTLLLGGTNPNAIAQSLYRNLNFEPLRDFTAVALIGLDSNALVVNPSVPAKTLQELVQYAKANPGKLTSGSTVGIGPHICLELFRARGSGFIGRTDSDRHDLQGGPPSPHPGRAAARARGDERGAMARASGRAHDGGKRIRPVSGVSTQRTACPGPNPRGHHRQAQRCDRRRAADARDAGQHRQARFRDQEPDGAGIWGQARRGSA